MNDKTKTYEGLLSSVAEREAYERYLNKSEGNPDNKESDHDERKPNIIH
jgi:hypothetical protein